MRTIEPRTQQEYNGGRRWRLRSLWWEAPIVQIGVPIALAHNTHTRSHEEWTDPNVSGSSGGKEEDDEEEDEEELEGSESSGVPNK